jgi:hypothetical protein
MTWARRFADMGFPAPEFQLLKLSLYMEGRPLQPRNFSCLNFRYTWRGALNELAG